ncbi:hypothetical protein [Neotabrizicola sp. sgz301269]|uniref:hypothetical protein n=1 Tax=Neotabrizicola sp. sgz301269 TaxID=3276282 RepID=UPI00376FB338
MKPFSAPISGPQLAWDRLVHRAQIMRASTRHRFGHPAHRAQDRAGGQKRKRHRKDEKADAQKGGARPDAVCDVFLPEPGLAQNHKRGNRLAVDQHPARHGGEPQVIVTIGRGVELRRAGRAVGRAGAGL